MSINKESYFYGAQKSAIRELFAYGCARKAEIGADKVFDYSLGNPSVPAPPEIKAAILKNLERESLDLHGYTPAQGLPEVRSAVATSLNRRFGAGSANADDLYMTVGAAASVTICINALAETGDEVVVISPYFPEYKVWIESAGALCVEVPADPVSFELDVDGVAAALSPKTAAVIINTPNNPVGVVYSRENLTALAAALEEASLRFDRTIALISDEPYRELTYGAEVPWVPAIYPATLVCYSYSKSLSLPGERIGWVLVPPAYPEHDECVAAVAGAGRKLGYVCAPALFQRVIEDCIDVPVDVAPYAKNRELLMRGLTHAGIDFVEPAGAFYLWGKVLGDDADKFFAEALKQELLIVPSDSFGCTGWFRAGYCTSYETIQASLGAWEALAAACR